MDNFPATHQHQGTGQKVEAIPASIPVRMRVPDAEHAGGWSWRDAVAYRCEDGSVEVRPRFDFERSFGLIPPPPQPEQQPAQSSEGEVKDPPAPPAEGQGDAPQGEAGKPDGTGNVDPAPGSGAPETKTDTPSDESSTA